MIPVRQQTAGLQCQPFGLARNASVLRHIRRKLTTSAAATTLVFAPISLHAEDGARNDDVLRVISELKAELKSHEAKLLTEQQRLRTELLATRRRLEAAERKLGGPRVATRPEV